MFKWINRIVGYSCIYTAYMSCIENVEWAMHITNVYVYMWVAPLSILATFALIALFIGVAKIDEAKKEDVIKLATDENKTGGIFFYFGCIASLLYLGIFAYTGNYIMSFIALYSMIVNISIVNVSKKVKMAAIKRLEESAQ